ncbi:MAG: hypothetical protein GY755_08835 [Chloroflexi bacterium]|nr:hypothetical protein [Chloroflexota bacterium]
MKNIRKITLLITLILAILLLSSCVGDPKAEYAKKELGSLSGRLFFDENSNKECDCECGVDNIDIRLYQDNCTGTFSRSIKSDEDGYYKFVDVAPGQYCIYPDISFSCEGFMSTNGINRVVKLKAGEDIEVEWFSYEIYFELESK